ncbi:ABC transporter substrate-binding protein [Halovivax limisalsi]|uniref:ABC transporter substrate-binding protein n=1 Tax=Halovivax limisalsi TaxID=1453760 RepID=UPI001FFD8543|nr:extracellular solute-binding protein [Halovivax limisalsi]
MVANPTRRQLTIAAGSAIGASLAGCLGGDSDDGSSEAVHLMTDYGSDAWQTKWNDELIPAFEEQSDHEINLEVTGGGSQAEQRLSTLVQSGDPPDTITNNHAGVAQNVAAGQLQSVDEINDAMSELAGDLVAPPIEFGDDVYQVPHGYYEATFLYREDVYEALDLSPPETFQDLLENARIIDESDEFDTRGIGVPASSGLVMADAFFRSLYNNTASARLRWASDSQEEVELWFPKEPAVEVLELVSELAAYSPDPSQIGFAQGLEDWGAGSYAQQIHLNMWPAGVAAAIDPEIARNTGVSHIPLQAGVAKEDTLLVNEVNGYFVFDGGGNTAGAREFIEWLYTDDLERLAGVYEPAPMRFLPTHEGVLESDAYQSISHFQEFPSHLEKLQQVQEISDEYVHNDWDGVTPIRTVEGIYLRQGYQLGEMLHEVLVAGMDPEEAYETYRSEMESRLSDAKERFE